MDKDRRKELREQYNNRHPDMGVVTWRCGEDIWVMTTKDANADYNSMSFQLKLEYDDLNEDCSEDLEIMMMEFMDEHPNAKPMKPGKK